MLQGPGLPSPYCGNRPSKHQPPWEGLQKDRHLGGRTSLHPSSSLSFVAPGVRRADTLGQTLKSGASRTDSNWEQTPTLTDYYGVNPLEVAEGPALGEPPAALKRQGGDSMGPDPGVSRIAFPKVQKAPTNGTLHTPAGCPAAEAVLDCKPWSQGPFTICNLCRNDSQSHKSNSASRCLYASLGRGCPGAGTDGGTERRFVFRCPSSSLPRRVAAENQTRET